MMEYKLDKILAERPLKTIYLDGNKVIKLMGKEYPASDVLSEALNLAAVGETKLKVPKLIEVTQIDGKWAIVWEYVKGITLAELMKNDPGHFDQYFEQFVDIQLEMHQYTATRLPLLLDKMHRKLFASGLDATVRYELRTRLDSLPRHTKLCHGDYNPSNIIITAEKEAYIIDWSHATQGNASADAAQTYILFYISKKTDIAEKYLSSFCKKSDTARQYVDKWISIVAASQIAKVKPEEKDILLQWANVVEYE
ncbi:MAG: phosphotransferase [Treponema sp.]|nr:phosphotransferase [Treponema sp.]